MKSTADAEVFVSENLVEVFVDVPSVKRTDLTVNVSRSIVVVNKRDGGRDVEIAWLPLPVKVNRDGTTASYNETGVLVVTCPREGGDVSPVRVARVANPRDSKQLARAVERLMRVREPVWGCVTW